MDQSKYEQPEEMHRQASTDTDEHDHLGISILGVGHGGTKRKVHKYDCWRGAKLYLDTEIQTR